MAAGGSAKPGKASAKVDEVVGKLVSDAQGALAAVDALCRDRGAATALAGELATRLARLEPGPVVGRALVALGTAQLALEDPKSARDSLLEGLAQLTAPGEDVARAQLRLASVEVALGNRQAARAALGRLGGPAALPDEDALLGELSAALGAAGETLGAAAVDTLRRERMGRGPAAGGRGAGTETRGDRFEVLARLVGGLNSGAAGTAEPLYAVLRAILDETRADRGFLMLYADATLRFEVGLNRAGQTLGPADFAYSTTIVERALEQGAPVVVPDVQAALPYASATSARELGLRAAACAPLRVERRRIGSAPGPAALAQVKGVAGVLYVDAAAAGALAPGDARFLEILADCAVLAVRARRAAEALAEAGKAASAQRPPRRRSVSDRSARDDGDQDEAPLRNVYDELVGKDPGLRALLAMIDRVAPTDASVLIRGESGTGKELVARALHRFGGRPNGPFVAVDCGAIPEDLAQHELFGHEKSAFTGAEDSRPGLVERAHGGTLFLDEVGEMPATMQASLLRVVQQGEVRRLGGDRVRPVDVRLVAATHRDLRTMVETGEFRQDLLFRLAVVELRVPPLRERLGDLPLLVDHLLGRLTSQGGAPPRVDPEAILRLEEHGWPGNIRELLNVLQAASLMASEGVITLAGVDHVLGRSPRGGASRAPGAAPGVAPGAAAALEGTLEEVERKAIAARLETFAWNQVQAAKSLGMDRNTLHRKIVRYGIQKP